MNLPYKNDYLLLVCHLTATSSFRVLGIGILSWILEIKGEEKGESFTEKLNGIIFIPDYLSALYKC
jgi:hypothetical protein